MKTRLALIVLGLAASAIPLLPSAAADCTYGSGPQCQGNCTINLAWCDAYGTCTVTLSGHCNGDCTINAGPCGSCNWHYQCYGNCIVNTGYCGIGDCTVNAEGWCDGHCVVNAGYCNPVETCVVKVETICAGSLGTRAASAPSPSGIAPPASPLLA